MGNSKEFVRIEDVIFLNIKKAGTLHELALCLINIFIPEIHLQFFHNIQQMLIAVHTVINNTFPGQVFKQLSCTINLCLFDWL